MRATSLGVKDFLRGGMPQDWRAVVSSELPRIQDLRLDRAPSLVSHSGKYIRANSDFLYCLISAISIGVLRCKYISYEA